MSLRFRSRTRRAECQSWVNLRRPVTATALPVYLQQTEMLTDGQHRRSVPHPDLYRQLGCEGQKRGRLRIERLEQRLGLFEIGRVEAFGEPAVDRPEMVAGLIFPPLSAQEASQADGGAQLEPAGALVSRHRQRSAKTTFDLFPVVGWQSAQEVAAQAVE